MYNKIAQIILNSGKASGASSVFVAQPDSLKESLAGKIFVLGEVGGKKSEGDKVINFLISDLNDNYYNDEKILLRGKIEGLKIENIFEAALAKMNKNLGEFLVSQKIKINSALTNLTVGVVYENKLHFANFGKNRALLIYRRSDGFEIINVETSAETLDGKVDKNNDERAAKLTGVFSSVISGEIPLGSYFIFTSESLPEYLSSREMVEIVTKLPPIVAAEQIKNTLAKINNYVPFLGIIIKNTTDSVGQEIKESIEEVLSAHTSISSLNSTEQRTERMLAPAGIISFKKVFHIIQTIVKKLFPKSPSLSRRVSKTTISNSDINLSQVSANQSSTRFETEKNNKLNLPSANSFSNPKKIRLKQTSYRFVYNIKRLFRSSPSLVQTSFWSGLYLNLNGWLKNLNKKNRLLFAGLILLVVIFSISLVVTNINSRRQKALDQFNALITQIEEKETLIDSHLLYNDEEGAARVLADAKVLIEALPRDKKSQQADYKRLLERLESTEKKVQKIMPVNNLEKIRDLAGLNISSLVFAGGKLYGASQTAVYTLALDDTSPLEIKVENSINLQGVKYDGKDTIYYRDGGKIIKFNVKDNKTSSADIKNFEEADNYSGFGLYASKVYISSPTKNQIYVYNNALSTRADWLKEAADISKAVDLFVDGSIYILNNNGSINKYHLNKKVEYANRALAPAVSSANKFLGDVQGKQLYILDNTAKRLAILAKDDGHLMSQYIFDSLSDLRDFALDETGKIIYLLSSDGVYKFAL